VACQNRRRSRLWSTVRRVVPRVLEEGLGCRYYL